MTKKKTKKRTKKARSAEAGRRRGGQKEWTVNDFVTNVWKTMEVKAEKNNTLKMLHARLAPEWNKVVQNIADLLEAKSSEDVSKRTEDICHYGERAVRPLIDALLKLKSAVETFKK